ncbi:MAG: hypothetical protein AB8B49_01015 [Nitratireductor sp.]
MQESISAVFLFWFGFVVSAGPFWTATMAAATTTSFKTLYKDYILYLLTGWVALICLIGLIVSQIGGINETINTALYFIGALVIFYMAYKILKSKPGVAGSFNFNWKNMTVLTWTNPKVWLLVPIGFLGANFTDNIWINIALFYIVGVPMFLSGLFCWGMIGRLGAKVSLTHVAKFNAAIMTVFGLYLLYAGFQLI